MMKILLDFFLLITSGIIGASVGTSTSSSPDNGSTTKAAEKTEGSFINVTIKNNLRSLNLKVQVTPPDNSKVLYITICHGNSECKNAKMLQDNKGSLDIKELDIGKCYFVNISAFTANRRYFHQFKGCTRPRPPGKENITLVSKSCTSLKLRIAHPKEGLFDGFIIKDKHSTNLVYSAEVSLQKEGHFSYAEVQMLKPDTHYDFVIYTVSNNICSKNAKKFSERTNKLCFDNQTSISTEKTFVSNVTLKDQSEESDSTSQSFSTSAKDQSPIPSTTNESSTVKYNLPQSLSTNAVDQSFQIQDQVRVGNSTSQSLVANTTIQTTFTQKVTDVANDLMVYGISTEQTTAEETGDKASDTIEQASNAMTSEPAVERTVSPSLDENRTRGCLSTQSAETTITVLDEAAHVTETSDVMITKETSDVRTTKETSDVTKTKETSDITITKDISDVTTVKEASDETVTKETSDVRTTKETSDVTTTKETSDITITKDISDVTTVKEASDETVTIETNDVILSTETNDVILSTETSGVKITTETSDVKISNDSVIVENETFDQSVMSSSWPEISSISSSSDINEDSTFEGSSEMAFSDESRSSTRPYSSSLKSTVNRFLNQTTTFSPSYASHFSTSTSVNTVRSTTPLPSTTTKRVLTPNDYNVTFEKSVAKKYTVYIEWPKQQDFYRVQAECKRSEVIITIDLAEPKLQINDTLPGDCCVVNVTGIGPKYLVVPPSGIAPMAPYIIPTLPTSTILNITWQQRSREWVDNFTVVLAEDFEVPMKTYEVKCVHSEPSCIAKEFVEQFICSSYQLTSQDNTTFSHDDNGTFNLLVNELRPWTTYHYNVTAHNKYGANSNAVTITTEQDKPGPPSNINITTLNLTSMIISWESPVEPNGIITEYNILYNDSDLQVDGNITTVTLNDLYCWKKYRVQVSASTSAGYGRESSAVGITDVYDRKPKFPEMIIDSNEIHLSFILPCENPSVIIEYNVSYTALDQNEANKTKWMSCDMNMPCNLTGLNSFWDYYIQVQETVDNVSGPWSTVWDVKTHSAKPGPPSNISITTLNLTSMAVSWQPPIELNGIIIGYNIVYNDNEIQVDGNVTMVTLNDLDCWTVYHVNVSARTLAGYGRESSAVGVTDVYDKPPSVNNVSRDTNKISLSFNLPCENPPVTIEYNVSYTALDHTCTGNLVNITRWISCYMHTSCDLTGLISYWDYYISIQEAVDNVSGPWSTVWDVKTLPTRPDRIRNLNISHINSTSMTVCWDRPCLINSNIIWYMVSTGNITKNISVNLIDGKIYQTQCEELSPLLPYTHYSVTVVAGNDQGVGKPVTGKDVRTTVARPNQPRGINVMKIYSRRLVISWLPPFPFPGPTTYRVIVRDSSSNKSCDTREYNETECTVNGLEEFWDYNIIVVAHTTSGESQSQPQTVKTKQSAPGPVSSLQVHPENDLEKLRKVFVQFQPPVYRERNGIIKAYYISCSDVRSQKVLNVIKLPAGDDLIKHDFVVPTQVLLNISVFAETIANGTQVFHTVLVPQKAQDFPVSSAVGGIVAAFIVFIIVLVIVGILYKKQMFCFKSPTQVKEVIQLKAVRQPKKKISVDSEDKRKNRPVKIDRFYQHVEIMARDSNHFFSKEYKELKAMVPTFATEAAETQECRLKNRYTNILPYDHSRVKLLPLDDEEGSDYINANYIPGYNSKREYIASQGPLPSTKDDFWRMIWEQNVSVIVMLTQCIERGKRKCDCYWPECVKEPVYYGDLSIEIENESHLPEYVLRTISITLANIKKYLKHFLYIAWPDMGVPSSTNSMIQLVKTVRSNVDPTMKGPITVHCSAGVGRTGTFIAVDIFLHQLDNDANEIDVFGDVLKLRNHRCNMVQTEDQYIFIHHCLNDYILALAEDTDEEDAYDGGDEAVYQNVPRRGIN